MGAKKACRFAGTKALLETREERANNEKNMIISMMQQEQRGSLWAVISCSLDGVEGCQRKERSAFANEKIHFQNDVFWEGFHVSSSKHHPGSVV